MNIVEAAEHVSNGLLVRRSAWHPENYMGLDSSGLYVRSPSQDVFAMYVQIHFSISIAELLATDWELYQVVRPKGGLVLKRR